MRSRLLSTLLTAAMVLSLLIVPSCAAEADPPLSDLTAGFHPTQFTFSDKGIQVTAGNYDGYEIDGTHLTITAPGRYDLSGTCADGQVTVQKGVTDVTLGLAGLELTNPDTAPITCGKGSHVTLYVVGGTENTLADGARNNDEVYPENTDAENAVIKCKDGSQVTLRGTGTLNITASGKNGVKSGATTETDGEAWMVIEELTLNINAPVNDAINAQAKLTIASGDLTISAADDAIHSDYTLVIGDTDLGSPTIRIESCTEGLEGADLTIYAGDVTVHSEDDGLNAANSDLTGYPFTLTIAGGKVYVDSQTGDGVDSNGSLTISGGDVTVFSSADGDNAPLDADGAFTVTGGTVLAVGSGAMAQQPTVKGQAYVAFGGRGSFGGGLDPDLGGNRPGVGLFPDPYPPKPMENEGQNVSDGQTPPAKPDGDDPDDDDQTPPAKPDGQAPQLPQDGRFPGGGQSAVTIAQGDALAVLDGEGRVLAQTQALRSANYVFFSAPDLTDGATYTLTVNGETALEAAATTQPGPAAGRPGGQEVSFDDVDLDDWFSAAVAFVARQGLMQGVDGTHFDPQSVATRATLWTILARMNGVDTQGGATWYEKAQAWAVANGVSDGTDPDRAVTREELITMLYRCWTALGNDADDLIDEVDDLLDDADDLLDDLDDLPYPDADDVSDWSLQAVRAFCRDNLVSGKSDGRLDPQGVATRAELAALLQRYVASTTNPGAPNP